MYAKWQKPSVLATFLMGLKFFQKNTKLLLTRSEPGVKLYLPQTKRLNFFERQKTFEK